jgi:hypothetical protein
VAWAPQEFLNECDRVSSGVFHSSRRRARPRSALLQVARSSEKGELAQPLGFGVAKERQERVSEHS